MITWLPERFGPGSSVPAWPATGPGLGQGHARSGEAGQIGGVEAVIFGVLVFVLGSLVIANAWGVIDAKLAVSSAASQATRAFVEAPSGQDPFVLARQAADQAVSDSGRDARRLTLSIDGTLARCSRVLITARYRVPLIGIPLLGSLGNGFVTTAHHSELVDPYRSGLPGSAQCATP